MRSLSTFASALVALGAAAGAQDPVFPDGQRCGLPDREARSLPSPADVPPSDCGLFSTNPSSAYDPTFLYDIPVVFHVIQNTSGTGFISATRIQQQMDVLNEDFQALPGSPGAPGTNAMIRFSLATVDPSGNPTTGITYSTNNQWFNDNGSYWNSLAWDPDRYMNVYTNDASGYLGYVPNLPQGGIVGQNSDRIVVLWSTVGSPAPYGAPYNLGRTLTHEVGHYLGLEHTFNGGCASASGCYTNGDLICDTNPESQETFGCPGSKSSCGSSDPFHNYMDYTDDACMWEFTPEQANRMRCTIQHWRPDLPLPAPPGQASNPSPPDGATDVSTNVILSWTGGSGATSYDVYFGTDPTPDAGEFQGNQAGTSFDPGPLAFDTTYYWRIDSVNSAGTTTGLFWDISTEPEIVTQPPGPPSSPVPFPGETAVDVFNTTLSWQPGFAASSHDVYFGTDPSPDAGEFQGNQTGTNFDPGPLLYNTTYYWRVESVNSAGTTPGPVWNFTTEVGGSPPSKATAPVPVDGASGVSILANLSWNAGGGATSRDVYFGTDSTPDAGELQGNQTATSFDPGTLAFGTTYFWRVDEVNSFGTTPGDVWSFATEAGPSLSVTGISPSTLDALNVGTGQIVTVTGTGFTPATTLEIDGVPVSGFPSPYTVVDGTTITFDPPLPVSLGVKTLTVREGAASDSIGFTFVANDPPALQAGTGNEPVSIFSFAGMDVISAGGPSDVFLFLVSSSNVPTVVPGLFSVDIGNNFSSLFLLLSPVLDARGLAEFNVPIGAGVPAGTTFYIEGLTVDALFTLPLRDSNTQEVTLLF